MLDQTHWLVPALTAALGGTLLLALVYYYLYARMSVPASAAASAGSSQ